MRIERTPKVERSPVREELPRKDQVRKTAAQKRKRRILRKAAVRAAIQVIFFVTMPGAFVAGFTGVRNIFEQIGGGKPLVISSFLINLVCLCLFTVVFGRFFCGYICAFGSLGDFVYFVSGLIRTKIFRRKKQFELPEKAAQIFRWSKYLILALVCIFSAFGLYGLVSAGDPWTIFSFMTSYRFNFGGYFPGLIVLILILGGMAVKERFFCRFLCPMGAVFSLLPILPFSFLQRDAEHCIRGCSACEKNCPAGIKLEPDGFQNGECIGCDRCTGICPKENISRWDLRLFGNEIVSVIIRAALFFGMGIGLGLLRTF